MAKKYLQQVLSSHFIRFSLIPIFIVEIALIVLYFSINAYISSRNINLLFSEAQSHIEEVLQNEVDVLDDKLNEVSMMAKLLQNEHEALFKNPNNFGLPNGQPSFEVAPNGVYYKTNSVGSSLYYSAETKIDENVKAKALFTEAMDTTFKSVVEVNPNIVAAYFNSWDNMNRLYPFIDEVYEQYGPHIQMDNYNFYYLADLKHNPEKKPAWTGAYLDPAGNGWMMSCVVPIYNGDFLEGVTGLDITIDSFVKNLLNKKLPYDANLFMVDKQGMILAMPEKIEQLLGLKELKEHLYTDAILKTIEKPEEFNVLKNNSPFASHFKKLFENNTSNTILKIENNEYLTLQQTVSETDWRLVILIDKSEVFSSIEELKELSNKIGFIAIGLLLLFYVVFFYILIKRINKFSHDITKPIEKLSEQTSEIKSTDTKIEVIKTDITEISQLNNNFLTMMKELDEKTQNLYESKEIAERLSKAKDDFLANMSHELKTPLNSINVISDLMKRNAHGNLDEKQIKSLDIINKCGKDLLFLINDVLDLSKLESGEIELNYSTINLKTIMDTTYEIMNSQAQSNEQEFTYHFDESIKLIYSDEERIKQIIKNLLSNALKFTPKGKKIDFKVKDDGDNVRVIVKDEGVGISDDKIEHIFDRFKQADSSTTRKFGGTGLGLAICKDLLALLKGDIFVTSSVYKGSVFEVVFPKNLEDIKNDTSDASIEQRSREKEKILLYNNDPIGFLSLAQEIKKHFRFKLSSNLETILDEYKKEKALFLVDETKLTKDEISEIETNISNEDIILIYEDEVKSSLSKNAKKILKKPVDIKQLINK